MRHHSDDVTLTSMKNGGIVMAAGKKDKVKYVVIPLVVVALLVVVLVFIVYKRLTAPTYQLSDNLDTAVITIDGDNITLRDTGVYIADVEETFDKMAKAYNPNDPMEFWKVHFSAGQDSTFTNDYAKTYVKNLYVYDYVMEKEAVGKGLDLTDAEKQEAVQEGKDAYIDLTDKAVDVLGLTQQAVIVVYTRKKLVKKYVTSMVKEMKESGYEGDDLASQLNFDGDFYNNNIKTKYNIKYDDKQWENLPIGKITIN